VDTSPETWQWIWLATAVVLIIGEMFVAGTFILLPFGISAAVACVMAFLDVGVGWQWAAFVGLGALLFVLLWRLARRFNRQSPMPVGVGAERLLGATGPVVDPIPGGPTSAGSVRLGAEIWRAESSGQEPVDAGTYVQVVAVRGTRVIVSPLTAPVTGES
jgi:membrane protein implicated in regulation of membrane protease activity